MKNYSKNPVFLFTAFLIGISSLYSFRVSTSDIKMTMDSPAYNGMHVGRSMVVGGSIEMLPEPFAWTFVRRTDFEPLWWLQGEVKLDAADNSWSQTVCFGTKDDIGHKFDVAIAVFTQKEHLQLKAYWIKAMQTGDWRPIEMPTPLSPPLVRKVLKTSH